MTKRELIRYAVSGSLRLFDSECGVRWENLPAAERADWFEFFDMCRDDPSPYTEPLIEAITAGLRPQKAEVEMGYSIWLPTEGTRRIWFFRPGKVFGPPCVLPAVFAEPTHYLADTVPANGRRLCIPAERVGGRWHRRFRKTAHAVRAFRHVAHAWAFLFSLL